MGVLLFLKQKNGAYVRITITPTSDVYHRSSCASIRRLLAGGELIRQSSGGNHG